MILKPKVSHTAKYGVSTAEQVEDARKQAQICPQE